MAFRRGRGLRLAQSLRRRTGWEEGPAAGSTTFSQATTGAVLWSVGLQIATDGVTLVRTRGFFYIDLVSASAVGDGTIWAAGIGVCSLEAFNAGIASVPTPGTDSDREVWLWHAFGRVGAQSTTAPIQPGNIIHFDIDSKAMRKVGVNDVIYGAWEPTSIVGTYGGRFAADSRLLFKLP